MPIHVGSQDGKTALIPVYAKPDGTVDPEIDYDDDDNITIRCRYKCHCDYATTLIPAKGAACPVTGFTALIRRGVKISPSGTPHWVNIDIQYGAYAVSLQRKSGDTVKEASAAQREFAVTDKRLGLTAAKQKQLLAKGQKTVGVTNPRYSYTQYSNSFGWTESEIISGVGSTGSPTGMTGATAANWMKTERSIRQAADSLAEIRDSWDYNENGWTVTDP